MSHMIEKEDTVYVPSDAIWRETWHGLQTQVEGKIQLEGGNIPDVFHPIGQCGMKPDLELTGEFAITGDNAIEMEKSMKNWKLIYADLRTNPKSNSIVPLHVPKEGYLIHQNRTLFDAMVKSAEKVLGADGFEIVTVGTLGGFSQFFVSIAIKGKDSFDMGKLANGETDIWKQFFNLNSSHNGLIASNRMLSTIRIVCMNTVQASISDAENGGTIQSIKHTKSSGELITEATFARDLEQWLTYSTKFQEALARLKSETLTLDQFRFFASGVFTLEDGNGKVLSDKLSTNSYNRIDDLTALFQRGQGNAGQSKYDAINAFTEYFTSGAGTGNPDKVKLSKRIASANFGRANQWKLQALDMLLDEKAFKSTLKRGKTLLNEKIAVMVTVGDTDAVETPPASRTN